MTVADLIIPTDVPTSMTPAEGAKLADLARGQVVLELGAWQGFSTICLAQTARVVHSVDWHNGDEHAGVGSTLVPYLQNLQRYGLLHSDRLVIHIGKFDSVLLPLELESEFFAGVFIDGQHDYAAVEKDWLLSPRPTDWIAFHDYGVKSSSVGGLEFGVTDFVDNEYGSPSEVVDTLAVVRL